MLWKIAKAGNDPAVAFAASELERCIMLIDPDAETAVLEYAQYDPDLTEVLWLGVCPKIVSRVVDPLLDDSYKVDIAERKGSIRGSNPRSVLMGVYGFLKALGCAWVRPGEDGEILVSKSLDAVEVHLDETPSYRHRGICIEGAVSYRHVIDMIDWMPKLGYNSYFNQFNTPVTFYDRWYSHQRNPLLDAEKMSVQEIKGIRNETIRQLKQRGLLYHEAGHGWTCEPFGIPGESWDTQQYDIPKSTAKYLAKVNGKRTLWGGIPLNTNLCYSSPAVRRKIADAVAERCKENPDIDFIQVWLADGTNNHCECSNCIKQRPADWYVTVLNEIDEKLTSLGLPTKVVFLLYVDLLWEPEKVSLKNPERFVLMFAPITRTYSASIADAEQFDENQLPPYERNHLQFPRNVGENLAWMRRWRKGFYGDGFDFDYHYMWDHFKDPGYFDMAKTLFKDMQSLHSVGLNGMMSCQNQRVFFPTGLGMTAMAEALWNEHSDFDSMANRYFKAAFGEDGPAVKTYMQSLSEAFDPVWMRGEKAAVDTEAAEKLAGVPAILDRFAEVIASNICDEAIPENMRVSWEYLLFHAELSRLEAKAFECKAKGENERAKQLLQEVFSYARQNEKALQHVFDVFEFQQTLNGVMNAGMQ